MKLASSGILKMAMKLTLVLMVFLITQEKAWGEERLILEKIENTSFEVFMKVSNSLYSGSQPKTDAAFKVLKDKGIKVIVSVDGARPNLEMAKKYGLRYIHIPIGYDQIEDTKILSFIKVARDVKEKVFLHCHHGKHRGPTAVAVLSIEKGICQSDEALSILTEAGTGKEYKGLWQEIRNYKTPANVSYWPELVPVADLGTIAEEMAKVDRLYDKLKESYNSGWEDSRSSPDFSPSQAALIIKESLRESGRHNAKDDESIRKLFLQSEQFAERLESALRAGKLNDANSSFLKLKKSCKDCHVSHRN